MNIQDKDTLHECTSCQMCAVVCPKKAIGIHLNQDGFYRPVIDGEKCVDCGICKSVCHLRHRSNSRSSGSDEGAEMAIVHMSAVSIVNLLANRDDVSLGTSLWIW